MPRCGHDKITTINRKRWFFNMSVMRVRVSFSMLVSSILGFVIAVPFSLLAGFLASPILYEYQMGRVDIGPGSVGTEALPGYPYRRFHRRYGTDGAFYNRSQARFYERQLPPSAEMERSNILYHRSAKRRADCRPD